MTQLEVGTGLRILEEEEPVCLAVLVIIAGKEYCMPPRDAHAVACAIQEAAGVAIAAEALATSFNDRLGALRAILHNADNAEARTPSVLITPPKGGPRCFS